MIPFFINISLETLSHIAGILGLFALLFSAIFAWRKKLLNVGFEKFQQIYRTEMIDFKQEVRRYIADNDKRHEKHLERITDLYVKISQKLDEQNRVCELVQNIKPQIQKEEAEWKKRIEKDLLEMSKKITHIEDCVNNKKK